MVARPGWQAVRVVGPDRSVLRIRFRILLLLSKNSKKKPWFLLFCDLRSMMKIDGSGSASGSISKRHGSADPDPDPHQNAMDPQHWDIRPLGLRIAYLVLGGQAGCLLLPHPLQRRHLLQLNRRPLLFRLSRLGPESTGTKHLVCS